MSPPYREILFLAILFGFSAVVSICQARRKKERMYYLGAVVGFLMLLVFVLALNQFLLAFVPFAAVGVLSAAVLHKAIKVQRREMTRELAKQLEEGVLFLESIIRNAAPMLQLKRRSKPWTKVKPRNVLDVGEK